MTNLERTFERGLGALVRVAQAEMVVATSEDVQVFDSPFTAAIVLSALAGRNDVQTLSIAKHCVDYLEDSRVQDGWWRFSTTWPQSGLLPCDADDTACALAAMHEWHRSGLEYRRLVHSLIGDLAGGLCRTWILSDGEEAPGGRSNEIDVVVCTNVLFLAARLGEELPEVAEFVKQFVDRQGLNSANESHYYKTPFAFSYFLARWLECEKADAGFTREVAWETLLRISDARGNALDSALTVSSMLRLGYVPRGNALEVAIEVIEREQSACGLWAAMPLFFDPEMKAYGSPQITTAICLEALRRYSALRAGRLSVDSLPGGSVTRVHTVDRSAGYCDPKGRDAMGRSRAGRLGDVIAAVSRSVGTTLIGSESWRVAQATCGELPAGVTDCLGFESRLGEREAYVDFAIAIDRGCGAAELLIRSDFAMENEEVSREDTAWGATHRFMDAWADRSSLLFDGVPRCWLEFDISSGHRTVGEPNVFIDLENFGNCVSKGSIDGEAWQERIIEAGLTALRRRVLDARERKVLRACLGELPGEGRIFSVGLMLARGSPGIRYCLAGVDLGYITSYLTSLNWRGPMKSVSELLEWGAPYAGNVRIALDTVGEVLPQVSIEFSPESARDGDRRATYEGLLGELVGLGLCQKWKRDALLAWEGAFSCREPADGEIVEAQYDRVLSHVKVSLGVGRKPVAKGYAAAWRRFSQRTACR